MVSRGWTHCRSRIILSVFLSLALALMLVPLGAFGRPNSAFAETLEPTLTDEDIVGLLAAQDYIDGEAIVLIDDTVADDSMRTLGFDLISSAEPIMAASESDYETAVSGTVASQAVDENGEIGAMATEEDTLSVRHITNTGMPTEELLRLLRDDPRVRYAEPNYLYQVEPSSNTANALQSILPAEETLDLTSYQWGNDSSDDALVTESKELGFDINPPSWNSQTQNATGTVAVVDTGVDYTHPDLAGIMRDDMQTFVPQGGPHGYNAVALDGDPMDIDGHGTHCAGIIASEWNGFGTSGVASGIKMVAVRIAYDNGSIPSAATLVAYAYLSEAMQAGLDLKAVNDSWGGGDTSLIFSIAVARLGSLGAISVVASGNDSADTDYIANSSAALSRNPFAVIVNSSNMCGSLSSFSNYGIATTNIIAPGSEILSTFPLAQSSYLPEAVDPASGSRNIVFESFTGALDEHSFKAHDNGEPFPTRIGSVSTTNYFDADDSSLLIDASDMYDSQYVGSSQTYPSKAFDATVLVPEEDQDDVRYLGFHLNFIGSKEVIGIALSIKAEDDQGQEGWIEFSKAYRQNEWEHVSIDLQSLASEQGLTPAYSEDNEMTIEFQCFTRDGLVLEGINQFNIDAFGLGRDGAAVPYQYLHGTSMAAPAATGAAMVLAATDTPTYDSMTRALERAARLEGSVRPVAEFEDLCTSGGALDLDYAQAGDYTPVVRTASASMAGGKILVAIAGWFFGDVFGSVAIGGKTAQVESWADDAITFACPEGLASGLHNIAVTTAAPDPGSSRTGQKSFLLELPSPPAEQGTQLYEREYPLPDSMEDRDAIISTAMAGLGGCLYLLPSNVAENDAFSTLWKLDPSSSEWTQCSNLPTPLAGASATTYDGKLIVTGGDAVSKEIAQCVFSYDPLTDAWSSLPSSNAPLIATVVNWNESLIMIGGVEFNEEANRLEAIDSISKYDPATGAITQIGSLTSPGYNLSAAVHGNDIIVVNRYAHSYISGGLGMNCITMNSGGAEVSSLLLPIFDTDRDNFLAVAPLESSVALIGSSAINSSLVTDDQDTYLINLIESTPDIDPTPTALSPAALGPAALNMDAEFEPFNKRVSHSQLFYVNAASHRGMLYAFGISYFEEGGYVLRATSAETLNQPGDLYSISYHGVDAAEHANPATYTAMRLPLALGLASDRAGATFGGWYRTADLSGEPVTSIAAGTTGDIELWAKWTPVTPLDPGNPTPLPKAGDAGAANMLMLFSLFALIGIGGISTGFLRSRKTR